MNLGFWLRRNLLRRKLRLLSQRAQTKLFLALRLPSLLPRSPVPDVDDHTTEYFLTVPNLSDTDLDLRVFGSEPVRLDICYKQWIDPLMNLPAGSTVGDMKEAAEKLPGYQPHGQCFFPTAEYLKLIGPTAKHRASWTHRLRATKYGLDEDGLATFLIYASPRLKGIRQSSS